MNPLTPLSAGTEINGILLVDKPKEWTSHDVCAFVRSRFRIPKVGHAGTLDPNATGLLVLLLGRFTRQSADWTGCDKDYEGVMELGIETDSHDRQGKILKESSAEEDLHKALDAGAEIIGINNRNLSTLAVNPHNAERLIPHIPAGKVIVVESGLKKHEEILSYKSIGAHAFLIGTTFMKSSDISQSFHQLLGKHSSTLIEGSHGKS